MQESLPETAPPEQAAAPSVEDSAPASDGSVATESAPGQASVPAARFNGLMGKFNQQQNVLRTTAAERDALQARIAELDGQQAPEGNPVTDDSLQQQVTALTGMLMTERLENARAKAIEDFPEARAFADLIVADTPEGIRDMARVLSERVKGQAPPAVEETPPAADAEPPATEGAEATPPAAEEPPAPVVAGGVTVAGDGAPSSAERVRDAIKERNFSAYLRAKSEQQLGSDLVLST